MDEVEVVTAVLNSTIARYSKKVNEYEVEVANLTAEMVRQKNRADELAAIIEEQGNSDNGEE